MTTSTLAVIFAYVSYPFLSAPSNAISSPTIMGGHEGPIQDASLQHRVVETILANSLQIFDED